MNGMSPDPYSYPLVGKGRLHLSLVVLNIKLV